MPDNIRIFERSVSGQANNIYDYTPTVSSIGDFAKLDGINVVINAIRTILLTSLGFYPFDPEYGSELYKKVFEMSDNILAEEIRFEVQDRIEQFEDRAKIRDVELKFSNDRKTIQVNVSIDRDGIPGTVSVYLPGPSGAFGLEDT